MRRDDRELQQQYSAPERSPGLTWKHWAMIVAAIIVIIVVVALIHLIAPFMGWWGPGLANVTGGTLLICIPAIPIAIGYSIYQENQRKNYKIRVHRPTSENAYPIIDLGGKFQEIANPIAPPVKVPQNQHYAPTTHQHNDPGQWLKVWQHGRTTISQEKPRELPSARDIHIPTFSESMNAGLIGPGQDKLLICYNLERDEETGDLTGHIEPYLEKQEDASTLFVGGSSGSGKTTFMSHLALQGAMMNALYYIIDPHLTHPEKSIAVKLQALSHAFILPPVQSDAEIYQMYQHAETECLARLHGKETPYSGRPIVFIIDEVLNVFGRAQRTESKELLAMYKNLALFMRDLGTQYNKYGVNGMFASQYVTKDACRLPQAQVDWRDGCQSQALLRLPPNQAQAMRLLDSTDLKDARRLPVGHGWMGFMNSDVIRMASGNVTMNDIRYAAMQVERVPGNGKMYAGYSTGTHSVPGSTRSTPGFTHTMEEVPADPVYEHNRSERSTGELESVINLDAEPLEQGTESVPGVPAGTERPGKLFTYDQEITFLRLYNRDRSIKRCLAAMHLSYGDYQACASRMVQRLNLKGR